MFISKEIYRQPLLSFFDSYWTDDIKKIRVFSRKKEKKTAKVNNLYP